jgi:Na+/H+ antiporter NhaD/arsenite permease-like protein
MINKSKHLLLDMMNIIKRPITKKSIIILSAFFAMLLFPLATFAGTGGDTIPAIGGIRVEFILFALTLIGVALFHNQTFWVAIIGLSSIILFKLIFNPTFEFFEHFFGTNSFINQLLHKGNRQGEWGILLNLLGLLLGFGILAKIFEESKIPEILPQYLPNDWKGPFVLLIFVFILSSFLDNIAAAMIGGTIALIVFKNKVHIGYIAAIVGASNAGGSGSVVGDTTTTMMWIDGVAVIDVFHAYIAAFIAFLVVAWFASHQQDKFQRIEKDAPIGVKVDLGHIMIVFMILIGAVISNFLLDMPALGVWIAIIIGATFRKIPWKEVPSSFKGTIFLMCIVTAASLMPVDSLPDASWISAFVLGFVSAVFDNIPLTKLCLQQGHFDWGVLAYAVGFGGSMIWFGSSAGVAITNKFPEARNVGLWIRKGWHVILGYILGFAAIMIFWGWHPEANKEHKEPAIECTVPNCPVAKKAHRGSTCVPRITDSTKTR